MSFTWISRYLEDLFILTLDFRYDKFLLNVMGECKSKFSSATVEGKLLIEFSQ
jgi:hypothetical protein